jgi:hypothetical protein
MASKSYNHHLTISNCSCFFHFTSPWLSSRALTMVPLHCTHSIITTQFPQISQFQIPYHHHITNLKPVPITTITSIKPANSEHPINQNHIISATSILQNNHQPDWKEERNLQ